MWEACAGDGKMGEDGGPSVRQPVLELVSSLLFVRTARDVNSWSQKRFVIAVFR